MKFKLPKIKKMPMPKAGLKRPFKSPVKIDFSKFKASFQKIAASKVSKVFAKVLLGIFFVVALATVVFSVMIYGFKKEDKITSQVAAIIPFPVAVVNYDFVTYQDYLAEKNYIHHFYQSTSQEGVNYAEVDRQIYDQLIENKIIEQEASRKKIKVTKTDVDSAVDSVVEQNGGLEKVEKVLNDLYGINIKQFRKLVRSQLLRDQVNDSVIARVEARHILIRVEKDAPEAKVNETKAKIDSILKEIQGGLDFSEAAKKYSEDTGSAEQGGKLEPFAKGEMVEEFSNAAFSTKVGEISEPVRSEFGWHLIKVDAKTGSVEKKFSDWTSEIIDKSFVLRFINL